MRYVLFTALLMSCATVPGAAQDAGTVPHLFSVGETYPVQGAWNEVTWSAYLAKYVGGVAELRLPDKSRVDVWDDTTKTAWEVEWCAKWPEAFGQAALYAAHTGGRAGVWLLKRPGDDKDFLQATTALQWYRAQGVDIMFRVTEVPEKPKQTE